MQRSDAEAAIVRERRQLRGGGGGLGLQPRIAGEIVSVSSGSARPSSFAGDDHECHTAQQLAAFRRSLPGLWLASTSRRRLRGGAPSGRPRGRWRCCATNSARRARLGERQQARNSRLGERRAARRWPGFRRCRRRRSARNWRRPRRPSPPHSRDRAPAPRRRCRRRPPPPGRSAAPPSAHSCATRWRKARAERDIGAGDRGAARAAIGVQHVAIERDRSSRPSRARSTTARRLRPIRRWISCVRPDCLPRAASRSPRVWVARGSMPYSAVTQPWPGRA